MFSSSMQTLAKNKLSKPEVIEHVHFTYLQVNIETFKTASESSKQAFLNGSS